MTDDKRQRLMEIQRRLNDEYTIMGLTLDDIAYLLALVNGAPERESAAREDGVRTGLKAAAEHWPVAHPAPEQAELRERLEAAFRYVLSIGPDRAKKLFDAIAPLLPQPAARVDEARVREWAEDWFNRWENLSHRQGAENINFWLTDLLLDFARTFPPSEIKK